MKFALALAVWIGFGALLAAGILKAMAGSPWLLLLFVLAYSALFVKYGCQSH